LKDDDDDDDDDVKVIANFKLRSRNSSEGTEKYHKNPYCSNRYLNKYLPKKFQMSCNLVETFRNLTQIAVFLLRHFFSSYLSSIPLNSQSPLLFSSFQIFPSAFYAFSPAGSLLPRDLYTVR
jgi:hypothetical protein